MSDYDDYYPDYDEGFGGGLMQEHTIGESLTKEEREAMDVPDVCVGVDDYDEYDEDNSFDEGDV